MPKLLAAEAAEAESAIAVAAIANFLNMSVPFSVVWRGRTADCVWRCVRRRWVNQRVGAEDDLVRVGLPLARCAGLCRRPMRNIWGCNREKKPTRRSHESVRQVREIGP